MALDFGYGYPSAAVSLYYTRVHSTVSFLPSFLPSFHHSFLRTVRSLFAHCHSLSLTVTHCWGVVHRLSISHFYVFPIVDTPITLFARNVLSINENPKLLVAALRCVDVDVRCRRSSFVVRRSSFVVRRSSSSSSNFDGFDGFGGFVLAFVRSFTGSLTRS